MEKDVKDEPIQINIGNICDGALIEAFEIKLQECLRNICDPNTEARQKRKITMAVELVPKDDRTQINVEFKCEVKLAGLIPSTSRFFIGKDADNALYALAEDPRQMNIFTPPAPVQAPTVIQFTGSK